MKLSVWIILGQLVYGLFLLNCLTQLEIGVGVLLDLQNPHHREVLRKSGTVFGFYIVAVLFQYALLLLFLTSENSNVIANFSEPFSVEADLVFLRSCNSLEGDFHLLNFFGFSTFVLQYKTVRLGSLNYSNPGDLALNNLILLPVLVWCGVL